MLTGQAMHRIVGLMLAAMTVLVMLREWGAGTRLDLWLIPLLFVATTLVLGAQVKASRQIFIVIALLLTGLGWLTVPDWPQVVLKGIATGAFIAAFLTALSTLRSAADTSPAITACGRFLAQQPPGKRYLALTVGGQLFALLLNYGSVTLLGSVAMANAREEPDAEIRLIRMKRMLLAVERAFIATLPWSPLSFAVAVSTAVIPGTSWAGVVLPCLVTGALMTVTGWALDSWLKPKLTRPAPPRKAPEGSWRLLFPLLALLGVLAVSVLALNMATGIRVPALVIAVVPAMAACWIAIQARGAGQAALPVLGRRTMAYLSEDLISFKGELVLLMMAGYIGTVGAQLVAPMVVWLGIDLQLVPAVVILIALVWLIPLAGQLGMNPILAVALLAPLLPAAAEIGITPTAYVVAVTAGWALSGACSPFTATNLLIGSFAGISAGEVGRGWNGLFTLSTGLLLTGWVVIYSLL